MGTAVKSEFLPSFHTFCKSEFFSSHLSERRLIMMKAKSFARVLAILVATCFLIPTFPIESKATNGKQVREFFALQTKRDRLENQMEQLTQRLSQKYAIIRALNAKMEKATAKYYRQDQKVNALVSEMQELHRSGDLDDAERERIASKVNKYEDKKEKLLALMYSLGQKLEQAKAQHASLLDQKFGVITQLKQLR